MLRRSVPPLFTEGALTGVWHIFTMTWIIWFNLWLNLVGFVSFKNFDKVILCQAKRFSYPNYWSSLPDHRTCWEGHGYWNVKQKKKKAVISLCRSTRHGIISDPFNFTNRFKVYFFCGLFAPSPFRRTLGSRLVCFMVAPTLINVLPTHHRSKN